MIFAASASLALLASTGAVAAADIPEPDPKAMSQAEIRAFNAKLEKGHKYFIRCKRSAPTGSFVSREFSCRTNAQWANADARGNQESRDVMDHFKGKAANTSN